MLFSEFGLIEPVLKAVEAEGYTTPSPIQAGAIPAALEGKDVLGIAQTGTGKTAAFALPAIHRLFSGPLPKPGARRPIRTLVIAPTRELAMQIRDSFITYGKNTPIRVIAVVGGISQDIQTRALRNGVDALIATPGRLVDLMRQRLIDLSAVEMLILDEADRMFDMGFAPDLKFITGALPAKRQNMLFSATMPGPIAELCRSLLKDPTRVEIKPEKTPMQIIDQCVMIVPRDAKNFTLTAYFRLHEPERAIVFTRTKHGADRVATVLARSGVPSGAIHGDKRQTARMKALADFKSGRIRVLVATDIAARGIDVSGISHVINFDMPGDAETYVHRVGRTGRAGASGKAVSLCQPEERRMILVLERMAGRKIPIERLDPALLAELPMQLPSHADDEFESFDDRPPSDGFRGGPRGEFAGPPGGPGFGNRGRRPAGKGGPVKYGSRSGPARFGGGPEGPGGPASSSGFGGPARAGRPNSPPRGRSSKGGPRKPSRGGPR